MKRSVPTLVVSAALLASGFIAGQAVRGGQATAEPQYRASAQQKIVRELRSIDATLDNSNTELSSIDAALKDSIGGEYLDDILTATEGTCRAVDGFPC